MNPSVLFAAPPDTPLDLVEAVVARCLVGEGVWASPRTSDGVLALRVVERTATRVQLCGRIWTIDQSLHGFWLDVERDDAEADAVRWILYFDIDPNEPRAQRLRDTIESFDDAVALSWAWELRGS